MRGLIIALILGVVFAAQSFSLAHATEHTGHDHEHHDGVACEITLIIAENIAVIPAPQPTPSFTPSVQIAPQTVFTSLDYVTPQGRAPPPRSPPFLF